MQRFRNAILLAVGAGFLIFQPMLRPIYAASEGATAGARSQSSGAAAEPEKPGAEAYANHCAICHGEQREGILPSFPPLLGITHQLTDPQIVDLIHKGKGRMPAFPTVQNDELTALLRYLASPGPSTSAVTSNAKDNAAGVHSSGLVEAGNALFRQNCAFCHGRDTMGGETGPDLTRSKLALSDVNGDKISEVVRDGRPEKKMPAFRFSSEELLSLAAFIHSQQVKAASKKGGRRRRCLRLADRQCGYGQAILQRRGNVCEVPFSHRRFGGHSESLRRSSAGGAHALSSRGQEPRDGYAPVWIENNGNAGVSG